MARRLLITDAGTGASNNVIRSLKAGDPSLFTVGCHDDRFVLKRSLAERNYLVPPSSRSDFAPVLRRVVENERIDLLIPSSDAGVRVASRLRRQIPCQVFLPRVATIRRCQDKYALTAFLRARGLPVPITYPVAHRSEIGDVFRRLPRRARVWCRIRIGSGSMGAVAVENAAQARRWIRCWEEMRGVPATSFTLSEYLPGRDFACQSIWTDGTLILVKTAERLSYFGNGGQPSVVSSVAALAKTVFEPRVVELCTEAVRALDENASGVFSIDLKENAGGVPCITEINAGRLSSGTNLLDLTGKHNMAVTYVRVALGEPVRLREEYDGVEDYYMLRDLDAVPVVFHADEFFEGIDEVWNEGSGQAHGRSSDRRGRDGLAIATEGTAGAQGHPGAQGSRGQGDVQQVQGGGEENHQDVRRAAGGEEAREAAKKLVDAHGMKEIPASGVRRLEITGALDRHALEALQLEIRRLSKRYGFDVQRLRVEKVRQGGVSARRGRRSG